MQWMHFMCFSNKQVHMPHVWQASLMHWCVWTWEVHSATVRQAGVPKECKSPIQGKKIAGQGDWYYR